MQEKEAQTEGSSCVKAQRKDRGTRFGSLKGQRLGRGCTHSRAWQRRWPLLCEQLQMVGKVCSGGRCGLTHTKGALKARKAAETGCWESMRNGHLRRGRLARATGPPEAGADGQQSPTPLFAPHQLEGPSP